MLIYVQGHCWQHCLLAKRKNWKHLKVHSTVMTITTLWTPMQTLKIMRDIVPKWKYHS